MAHVSVTIAGRTFRMACEEGEEARLTELAGRVDARIGELAAAFDSVDELRLTVMAALSIADDLSAAEQRLKTQEAETAALRDALATEKARARAQETQFTTAIHAAAERVENITSDLTPALQA